MAAKSVKPGMRGTVTAVFACLCLWLAGCGPGPPQPFPPLPPPGPGIPGGFAPGESVHFTAQGDIGVRTTSKQVLDTIAGLRPQFNLALGDFSYKPGIEQEFCDMVKGKLGADFPYQLITGNHESDGSDGDIAKFVECLPNKLPGLRGEYGTQWYVDVPETNPLVRVIMVSPGIDFQNEKQLDFSSHSERWNWTTNAIDGAAAANIPWTVVGMHAPCLSVGEYDCEVGQDFATVLLEEKVDLVLTGHDHVYQRTHQLGTGASCPALVSNKVSAGCITDSDADMVKGAGTVFATVGVGGESLYEVNPRDTEAGYFAAWSGKNRDPAFGTLDVTATADRLSARFVPAKGYTFTDAFSITRR
jgi:hypothetical protein